MVGEAEVVVVVVAAAEAVGWKEATVVGEVAEEVESRKPLVGVVVEEAAVSFQIHL